MRGPGGTIAVKGHYAGAARAEAAELWSCSAEEIEVTGEEPYNNGTFVYATTEAQA